MAALAGLCLLAEGVEGEDFIVALFLGRPLDTSGDCVRYAPCYALFVTAYVMRLFSGPCRDGRIHRFVSWPL
jgi:hypothetical protein